jgi:hypothetical protein
MAEEFERRWHDPNRGTRQNKQLITASELRVLISEKLKDKLGENFDLFIADSKYYCPPLKDARVIIKKSKVNRRKWVFNRFDCDDFAHVLKAHFAEAAYADGERRYAHCFGILWERPSYIFSHAINWMVNDDLELRFIEPQKDRIFNPRKADKNIYFMLV